MGIAAMIILGVCYFEGVNRHVQMDRQLALDPQIAEWYSSAKLSAESIDEGGPAQANEAIAVWYGEIDYLTEPNSIQGPTAVEIIDARLMAGSKGQGDRATKISIRTRNDEFVRQRPQKGDEWVFLVRRDDSGTNHLQSAACYRRATGS